MSYIVILMSFQTIYSINYGQNYEMFIAPPPLRYIENFQSPQLGPPLMPENISVPPPNIFIPPPRHNKCTFPKEHKSCLKVARNKKNLLLIKFKNLFVLMITLISRHTLIKSFIQFLQARINCLEL